MKNIINKYNIIAKKNLGQNFLTDDMMIKKIISFMEIDENTNVLEIGPGYGAVTKEYIKSAKKVLLYEIDSSLCEVLEKEYSEKQNVVIVNQDFLKVDIESDLKKYFTDGKNIVISNLPYYITTPIIFKLLEKDYGFSHFYFMMQKEVGDRLTGKPKTKDYNALSVLMKYKTTSETLFNVSRNCFYPVPGVDSSFLRMTYNKTDCGVKNEPNFLKFIESIFRMRRKTLVNNLIATYPLIKGNTEDILVKLGFSKAVRSEELTLDDIALIYKELFEVAK